MPPLPKVKDVLVERAGAARLSHSRTGLSGALVLLIPGWACAQAVAPPSAAAAAPSTVSQRDGSHDFDFLIGDWKAHLRRMVDRETGVTTSDARTGTWVEYEGICNDKKLLDTN